MRAKLTIIISLVLTVFAIVGCPHKGGGGGGGGGVTKPANTDCSKGNLHVSVTAFSVSHVNGSNTEYKTTVTATVTCDDSAPGTPVKGAKVSLSYVGGDDIFTTDANGQTTWSGGWKVGDPVGTDVTALVCDVDGNEVTDKTQVKKK